VQLTKRFRKNFRKLDKQIQQKIMEEIEVLKTTPEIGEKLKGVLSNFRRIRILNYRLIYRVHSSNGVIEICFVDHRKRVYQELGRLRKEECI